MAISEGFDNVISNTDLENLRPAKEGQIFSILVS